MRFGISSSGRTWVSFGWFGALVYGLLWLLAAMVVAVVAVCWVLLQAAIALGAAAGRAWHRRHERELPRLV